jgi:putative hemolysin
LGDIAVELLIIALLLVLNAFLAGSEIALVSASRPRLRARAEQGDKGAGRVLTLTESPAQFLATIQIGITLAGFFAAAVGAITLTNTVEDWLGHLPIDFFERNSRVIAVVLITTLLSFLSIVVGELVPKTLAVERAERIAVLVSRPITLLSRLMRPIVSLLTAATNLILRVTGSRERANFPTVTHEEILSLLETAEDEGVVEASDADLVEEALQFGEIQVRSVMVPRVDLKALEADASLGEALKLFFQTGYSRLPVYRETPDDILGILHIKDVFRLIWDNRNAASLRVAELIRPAYVVPETLPIDDLLRDLRARRTHMAIVVDEYGGIAGLVTLEDLLEELVGEIADEFDPGYEPLREIEPGVFDVDGRLSLLDLADRIDLPRNVLDSIEAESVGGLISERIERIPEAGDIVEIGPLRLEVTAMDGYRVAVVQVRQREEEAPAEEGDETRSE